MDNQAIIDSPVFKALNVMIDSKIAEMRWNAQLIQESATRESQYKVQVTTRTYDEGQASELMPFTRDDVNRIARCIADYQQLEKEISDLQTFKLKLLNDYDFTHGDDKLQKLIFPVVDTKW